MTFGKNVEHFLVWLFSNLSKHKSQTAEIIGIYFIGTVVGLSFFFDKSNNNQTKKGSTFFPNVI